MNVTTRLGRRLAAGVSLAAAAILLPTAALASSAAAGAPAARPAIPACGSSVTDVWYGLPGNGTAGASYYELEFTNTGHSACSL